jgi:hypothetical protein
MKNVESGPDRDSKRVPSEHKPRELPLDQPVLFPSSYFKSRYFVFLEVFFIRNKTTTHFSVSDYFSVR